MKNVEDIYPLSPTQSGMLFHTIAAPESGVYFEQYTCLLLGELDTDAFECAWQQIIDRHPVLRTTFIWDGIDTPMQVVRQKAKVRLDCYDWQAIPAAEQSARIGAFLTQDRRNGFDLASAPITRVTLIKKAPTEHHMIWSFHHLISDGWSTPLILKEVFAWYESTLAQQSARLPNRRPYRDYIAWLKQQDMLAAEQFWRSELRGFDTPTELPVENFLPQDKSSPLDVDGNSYQKKSCQLSTESTGTLQTFAQENRLTLNTIVQGAWALLLSRYSGESDVLFGATVSGRPTSLRGVEEMIGMFINTLPVRVDVASTAEVLPWLQSLQLRQLDIRQYEYSALSDVQRWSELGSGKPLFNTIVVFENYPQTGDSLLSTASHLSIQDIEYHEQSNFPLSLLIIPDTQLTLHIVYDQSIYADDVITRMLGHLQTIIKGLSTNPSGCLQDVGMLTAAETQQILVKWNDTAGEYQSKQYIHHLIEEQGQLAPTATAVVFQEERLSYSELDAKTNELAQRLVELEIGPNSIVGICLERSIEMIVAILGTLKAGGAYLPLDPSYPTSRLNFMLEDTKAPILITTPGLLSTLPDLAVQVESSSTLADSQLDESDYIIRSTKYDQRNSASAQDFAVEQFSTPDDLAYVIYTSGSTGTPKGVPITHRNLVHSTTARFHYYPQAPQGFLLLSSFAFDSSMVGIFWTLCSGGTLVLPRQREEQDIAHLALLIAENQVSHTLCLPSIHQLFLTYAEREQLNSLTTVIVAGEACPSVLVAQHYATLPAAVLYNEYGPTEGTVWATACRLDPTAPVTIGRPIPNMQTYILDEHRSPVPIGVPGELYICGQGVASGYLNRPQLTAEKFLDLDVADFLSTKTTRKAYRTGDLARYLPDGSIEFLGRIDEQVKLRGHRIELGEIEAILAQHPDVETAVAIMQRVQSPSHSDAANGNEADERNKFASNDIDLLLEQAQRLGPEQVEALLTEIELRAEVEADAQPEERAGTSQHVRSQQNFDLTLNIKREHFIDPPRAAQRQWLLNKTITEFCADVNALDALANRFVRGADSIYIEEHHNRASSPLTDVEIMEDWQIPLMRVMAEIVTESHGHILEVGFGRGISADFIMEAGVQSYTAIECNDSVIERFGEWSKRWPACETQMIAGMWQDSIDQLGEYDGILFHTYALNEEEYIEYIVESVTFAEHFFPVAAAHLKPGGIFTYFTGEMDSFSRSHQRLLFRHFREFSLQMVDDLPIPEDIEDSWWLDSMVAVKAIK